MRERERERERGEQGGAERAPPLAFLVLAGAKSVSSVPRSPRSASSSGSNSSSNSSVVVRAATAASGCNVRAARKTTSPRSVRCVMRENLRASQPHGTRVRTLRKFLRRPQPLQRLAAKHCSTLLERSRQHGSSSRTLSALLLRISNKNVRSGELERNERRKRREVGRKGKSERKLKSA